jgi:hypothetical protein
VQSAGTMQQVVGEAAYPLRLPRELKEKLEAWARQERRSLNGHMVRLLEIAVERHEREQDGDH